MKKITLIASSALLLATVAFTSCKKDYTCVCSYTDPTSNTTTSVESPLGKHTKKDAKSACEGLNNNYAMFTGVTCKLK